jgi:mRNA-degrading endonuclease HigB of HigAB toxin-antitoxin module
VQSSLKRRIKNQNGGQNRGNHKNLLKNTNNVAYCTYCCQPGHIKSNCFKLKNKSNRNRATSNNDGQGHRILIPMMFRLQKLPWKTIFQMT